MHFNFRALSISYKSTPVKIREKYALNESQVNDILKYVKEFTDISEMLILSTCNRMEVYYQAETDKSKEIIKLIGIQKNIENSEQCISYFKIINDHHQAVNNLFEVSMGLDSKVVGDIQISNQIKRAYQLSADAAMSGPFLHRLMHTIFFTNKKVVQETAFRDGAASVSYAATEIVAEVSQSFISPRILVIGLGEIGLDVCRNLLSKDLKNISIANRTFERAKVISDEYGFNAMRYQAAFTTLENFDIIISSLNVNEPVITKDLIEGFKGKSHKYLFDLSVPRSIATDVEDASGVILYNIDDINAKANATLTKRMNAVPKVKLLIKESLSDFNAWTNEMTVSPVINKLKLALEEIRQAEIAKALKGSKSRDTEMIDRITKGMMQKIIKLPVMQLKAACKRGEEETLIDVLNDLFNLEQKPVKK